MQYIIELQLEFQNWNVYTGDNQPQFNAFKIVDIINVVH